MSPLKYWCKTTDGVEGPFEARALKFIDGFSPDILVSPDSPGEPESWVRFSEVAELQAVINQNPKTGPAPVVIQAPSTPLRSAQDEDPPTLSEAAAGDRVEGRDEFTASSEMLDLMQKISREMEEKKAESPVLTPAEVPVLDLSKIKPVRKQLKESLRPVLATAAVLVMVGLGVLAVKTDAPKKWFDLFQARFHKTEKIPVQAAPAPVATAPATPAPVAVKQSAPAKPASLPGIPPMTKRKAEAKKEPQAAKAPHALSGVEGAAAPEKDKKLATQKFYLPGVPSPKLAASKIDRATPLPASPAGGPEAEAEAAAPEEPEEKAVSYGKSAKGAKSSGNEDWKKQASWGD